MCTGNLSLVRPVGFLWVIHMGARNNLWLLLSLQLLAFVLSLQPPTSSAADAISGGASLTGDQTLVSSGGNFVLGFFSPGKSPNFYLGIWYSTSKVSTQTVVWVANRDRPITHKPSAELKIQNGNLVVLNGSQTPVWSTGLNSSASSSQQLEAVMLDSGNFVLRLLSNTSRASPIWQSFDHPSHIWLPGSKLGLDKRTGKNQQLTSWKNSEDPSPGLFTLYLDPNGSSQYLISWNNSRQYWTSGPWNGAIFSLVPEMNLNYAYNFSYVDNKNESYFIYSMYDTSIISRFIMDVSGQVKQETWLNNTKQWNLFWSQPRQQCEVYDFCGGYGSCKNDLPFCSCVTGFQPRSDSDWGLSDYSGGCVRKTPLKCGSNSTANREKDRFLVISSVKLPEHAQPVAAGGAMECESKCLANCSCIAYAYESGGCSIWTGDLENTQQLSQGDSSGKSLYIRLAASEFHEKSNKGTTVGITAGSIAVVLALLGLVAAFYLRRRRRSVVSAKAVEGSLVAFGYRDLQVATKNFSDKLGGGGFGSVFKGILPDLTVIAVKKLDSISQGEKQFRTEVSTIGTIQHVNLIRLRGFCSDNNKKLLVYDYMPNGSLDAYLFHGKDSIVIDWKTRYQIALGTARGLVYLHEKCRDCIIHCDIKPENILLDADFCPKVADFGLAKLVGRDFSRVLTTMRGTRGYLAPEWISGVAITAKADVYSFGMMLFELTSGTRNSEASKDGKPRFFPNWAASLIAEGGDILSLLDHRLEGDADSEEVTRVCKLACWCIQDDETHRPPMSQVVQILEGILDINVPPIPSSLQLFVDNQEHIVFFTESSSGQSSQTKSSSSAASRSSLTTSSVSSKPQME